MIRSHLLTGWKEEAQPSSEVSGDTIFRTISQFEAYYPRLSQWYFRTVVPGLLARNRRVFLRLSQEGIAGLAIAKRGAENKLCTLWVHPKMRERGVAMDLAQEAFSWMKDDHPLFTVPEERVSEFRCLLDRWKFMQTGEIQSAYRPGKAEFVFNGPLT